MVPLPNPESINRFDEQLAVDVLISSSSLLPAADIPMLFHHTHGIISWFCRGVDLESRLPHKTVNSMLQHGIVNNKLMGVWVK